MKTVFGRSTSYVFEYPSLRHVGWVFFLALLMTGEPCAAQSVPTPPTAQSVPPPPTVDPKACSDEQRLRLGNGTTRQPSERSNQTFGEKLADPSNQTLSEKLERTEGVICPPPGIDPEIATAPPGGGITPVIPPPGSPGGDPTVRPR
jgi:hypothetical protein